MLKTIAASVNKPQVGFHGNKRNLYTKSCGAEDTAMCNWTYLVSCTKSSQLLQGLISLFHMNCPIANTCCSLVNTARDLMQGTPAELRFSSVQWA